MENGRVRQAVILAAGNGSRLAKKTSLPKPLVSVAGRALLDKILGQLNSAGIERVTVVVGHRAEEIQKYPLTGFPQSSISWVVNPRFDLPNGLSLLAAENTVDSHFVLVMSDHLFQKSTLTDLMQKSVPAHGGILAVDSKIDRVFDLEDATKVESHESRIRKIGKHLPAFDSIDTGMFLLSIEVFRAMRRSLNAGDASLSGGISALAQNGGVEAWDIGARRWIDVDTPAAHSEAERLVTSGYFD